MQLTWFNAPYVEKSLEDPSAEYIFFGRVSYRRMSPEMVNPIIEKVDSGTSKMGKIVPIYPATGGLQQRSIRDAVTQAVLKLGEKLPESLPEEIRQKYDLIDIERAIRSVHMPETFDDFYTARRRLVFEEFLKLQLGVATVKAH